MSADNQSYREIIALVYGSVRHSGEPFDSLSTKPEVFGLHAIYSMSKGIVRAVLSKLTD